MIRIKNKSIVALIIAVYIPKNPCFRVGLAAQAYSKPHFGEGAIRTLDWVGYYYKKISKDPQVSADTYQSQKQEQNLSITPEYKLSNGDPWSDVNFDECAKLWELNQEDKLKLRILQKSLSNVKHWMNDPYEVVRFLTEYDGDIEITEHKFRNMIDWRNKNDVDKILHDYTPPPLYDYFPLAVLKGVDKEGDPIHVERTGASDMLGILEKYGREEMIKHAIWVREQDSHGQWQKEYQQKQGRHVKKFTVVMDMQGFNRKHISPSLTPVGKEVTKFVQNNYPGFTKKIIIIRAPAIFRVGWSMFKPFLDSKTKERIEFSSAKDYEEVLKRYIDPEVLPKVISKEGRGEAAEGFHPVWEGGSVAFQ